MISPAAATPSTPPMEMSMRTTSGRCSRYAWRACEPSEHSITSVANGPVISAIIRRTRALSSTIRSLIGRLGTSLTCPQRMEGACQAGREGVRTICVWSNARSSVRYRTDRPGRAGAWLYSSPLMLERELQDGVVALQAELLRDADAVVLDGPVVHEQLPGDVLARVPGGDELQDLALGRGERAEAWLTLGQGTLAGTMADEQRRERRRHVVPVPPPRP